MSRHYVLDFDGTLYDTESLWDRWAAELVAQGVELEHAAQTAETLFHEGFTLGGHARAVGIKEEQARGLVESFEKYMRETGPSLVYQDVPTFLSERPSTILTHGETDFQHFKIQTAGLGGHVGEIRIAGPAYRKSQHLTEMLEKAEKPLLFVDDNPAELLRVHDAGLPVELARMRRPGQRHAAEDHEFDDQAWRVIRSLSELE